MENNKLEFALTNTYRIACKIAFVLIHHSQFRFVSKLNKLCIHKTVEINEKNNGPIYHSGFDYLSTHFNDFEFMARHIEHLFRAQSTILALSCK